MNAIGFTYTYIHTSILNLTLTNVYPSNEPRSTQKLNPLIYTKPTLIYLTNVF